MKSYTDIEQSKKLAEILPIKSADMWYQHIGWKYLADNSEVPIYFPMVIRDCESDDDIPCWSLAALLNYIKDKCGYFHVYISSTFNGSANKLENVNRLSTDIYDVYENELIDACYEMILKLYEQKLL